MRQCRECCGHCYEGQSQTNKTQGFPRQRRRRKKHSLEYIVRKEPPIAPCSKLISLRSHKACNSQSSFYAIAVILFSPIFIANQLVSQDLHSLVDAQIILDHPHHQSRTNVAKPILNLSRPINFSPPYSMPFHYKYDERPSIQRIKIPRQAQEISTAKNQSEFLKKLSSRRLLETLSREITSRKTTNLSGTRLNPKSQIAADVEHSIKSNRTIIHLDSFKGSNKTESNHDNEDRITLETALHQSTINNGKKSDDDKKVPFTSGNLFNASSLNYLVEKLLNVDSLKQSTRIPVYPSKRPQPRKRIQQIGDPPANLGQLNLLRDAPKTLDILIRDEYNSRVQPMLQSLLNQRRLSGQQTRQPDSMDNLVTRTGPANHKTTEIYSTMSSTSLDPIATSLYKEEPSTITNLSSTIISGADQDQNTMVDFEDLLDLEGDGEGDDPQEEYDDPEKVRAPNIDKPLSHKSKSVQNSTRLRNVPPYQLSVNLYTTSPKPVVKTEQSEMPTTTSSTVNTITTRSELNDEQKQQGRRDNVNLKAVERDAVATNRGSLVFSDGAEEAMRLNRTNSRKKVHSNTELDMVNPHTLTSLGSHSGEANLLKQLFSTLRPSRDSQVKSSEHTKVVQRDQLANNPLVYSGYVGKDDYLISSISSDWSRPLTNRETNTTGIYKYPYNSLSTSTRRPSSYRPTTYSTYLEQPVTNAQSVPFMVIPTKDIPNPKSLRPTYPPELLIDHHQRGFNPLHNQSSDDSLGNRAHLYTTYGPYFNVTALGNTQRSIASLNEKGNAVETSGNHLPSAGQVHSSGHDVYLSKNFKQLPSRHADSSFSGNNSDGVSLKQADQISSPPLVSIVGDKSGSKFHKTNVKLPDEASMNPVLLANYESKNSSQQEKIDPSGQAGERKVLIDTVSLSHADGKSYSHHVLSQDAPDISSVDPTLSLSNDSGITTQTTSDFGLNKNMKRHKYRLDDMHSRREKPRTSMQDYQASESDQHELSSQLQISSKQSSVTDSLEKSKPHKNSSHVGSEISTAGMDRRDHNGQRRNLTSILNKTSLDIGDDGSLTHSVNQSTTVGMPSSASAGSTIIPESNFFSEASSESPFYDKSITLTGADRGNKPGHSSPDLYQRIGSVGGGSGVSSNNNIETRDVNSNKQNDLSLNTTTKTASKSNDRMAFILIGGSCALSVVCLVFAAMSMRCQDMCDDYRSLRNAERAALKLQKHRLRYTKNHQVNRLNAMNNSNGSQLDDLNMVNGIKQDSLTGKILDFNVVNNSRCLNAPGNGSSKPPEHVDCNNVGMINNNGLSNERSPRFAAWNAPNCQIPVSALVHRDGLCGCSNCINYRWMAQNEMVANNKHLSLLHPYYFMQNQSRLKPPFGAGSSVGTFFPRRLGDQSFCEGGSSDAQILVDNHRAHSCHAGLDQRGLLQSKSILQRSKRFHSRHSARVEPLNCNDVANLECNNPNHAHHIHKYDLEPSASEESEITIDESILCDSAKCSLHPQSRYHCHHPVTQDCMKVQHPKQQQNSHVGRPTKAKSSQPHHPHQHHHHHHHAHQQVSSSSDAGSITQCTCNRDQQPLISGNHTRQQSTRHKVVDYKHPKHDLRSSMKRHGRRDKSLLIWSTNRDQLI